MTDVRRTLHEKFLGVCDQHMPVNKAVNENNWKKDKKKGTDLVNRASLSVLSIWTEASAFLARSDISAIW
jgi:hypothetical protein